MTITEINAKIDGLLKQAQTALAEAKTLADANGLTICFYPNPDTTAGELEINSYGEWVAYNSGWQSSDSCW